jgi:hypothetical protein
MKGNLMGISVIELTTQSASKSSLAIVGHIEDIRVIAEKPITLVVDDTEGGLGRTFLHVDFAKSGDMLYRVRGDTHDIHGKVRPDGDAFYIDGRGIQCSCVESDVKKKSKEDLLLARIVIQWSTP